MPPKPKPARLAHPDAKVTTSQAERDAWAVKTLLRKQAAGEALTELQLALVERVAPGSAARAAEAARAAPAQALAPAAAGKKRVRDGESATVVIRGRGAMNSVATLDAGARALSNAAAGVSAEEKAKAAARAARFAKS